MHPGLRTPFFSPRRDRIPTLLRSFTPNHHPGSIRPLPGYTTGPDPRRTTTTGHIRHRASKTFLHDPCPTTLLDIRIRIHRQPTATRFLSTTPDTTLWDIFSRSHPTTRVRSRRARYLLSFRRACTGCVSKTTTERQSVVTRRPGLPDSRRPTRHPALRGLPNMNAATVAKASVALAVSRFVPTSRLFNWTTEYLIFSTQIHLNSHTGEKRTSMICASSNGY